MSRTKWYVLLGILLIAASVVTYILQVIVFHKIEDTFFYMLQDLAFVPVQVLLVMLLIDRLLQKKERESLLNKLNMTIGVFFNEVGTDLMALFLEADQSRDTLSRDMMIGVSWRDRDFFLRGRGVSSYEPDVQVNPEMLGRLKSYLIGRRDSLLRLLANPNLLEHERFTDLLWAVFHLADELQHRPLLERLPPADIDHLKGDVIRAYRIIVVEWLQYMKHLKKNYPYLFSIAVRANPFNPEARIEIS